MVHLEILKASRRFIFIFCWDPSLNSLLYQTKWRLEGAPEHEMDAGTGGVAGTLPELTPQALHCSSCHHSAHPVESGDQPGKGWGPGKQQQAYGNTGKWQTWRPLGRRSIRTGEGVAAACMGPRCEWGESWTAHPEHPSKFPSNLLSLLKDSVTKFCHLNQIIMMMM